MVGRTAFIVGVTTASLAIVTINQLGGPEIVPAAAEAQVQAAAPAPELGPVLIGAGKKPFKAQAEAQTLQITGANFTPGSTATLVAPHGLVTTFVSASLVELTPKSFKIAVILDEPGTYLLQIRTASGVRSNPVPMTVTR